MFYGANNVLRRGLDAYIDAFSTDSGIPKYTHISVYPVDIHCAATAIDFLARARGLSSDCLPLAGRVYHWMISNMRDPQGFFYFQKHRLYTNKIPYIRWGQAHMFKALATLLEKIGDHG